MQWSLDFSRVNHWQSTLSLHFSMHSSRVPMAYESTKSPWHLKAPWHSRGGQLFGITTNTHFFVDLSKFNLCNGLLTSSKPRTIWRHVSALLNWWLCQVWSEKRLMVNEYIFTYTLTMWHTVSDHWCIQGMARLPVGQHLPLCSWCTAGRVPVLAPKTTSCTRPPSFRRTCGIAQHLQCT